MNEVGVSNIVKFLSPSVNVVSEAEGWWEGEPAPACTDEMSVNPPPMRLGATGGAE